MDEALPPWADPELSKALYEDAAKGEGRTVEFKEDIPEQARDLAKGVAAFSTSGAGTILIGVTKHGHIVGLSSVGTAHERDDFAQRVQGIVRENVKPRPSWRLVWAVNAGKTIARLVVEKGCEPVYYYEGRPYLRDGASSRPAQPDEAAHRAMDGEVRAGDAGHAVRRGSVPRDGREMGTELVPGGDGGDGMWESESYAA